MKGLSRVQRLVAVLAISSLASILLYLIGLVYYDSSIFWFLNWNLVLAWLPLVFALWLTYYLKTKPWISWAAAGITLLWLGFLPNSFYLISDLMHLNSIYTLDPLFYAVMIFSYCFNGLILGFASLYLVHYQLLKRMKSNYAHIIVGIVILLCSFAIYLGRYLRWSTWDVIVNPAGVIFDVSDRFINPVEYGQTFQVTTWFFILLGSMYFVLWNLVQIIRQQKS
jgi:uncharacterized membrane protein